VDSPTHPAQPQLQHCLQLELLLLPLLYPNCLLLMLVFYILSGCGAINRCRWRPQLV